MERLKLFDAAYDVCIKLADNEKADEMARASAFHHKGVGDKEAMLAAVRCFSSADSQLRFLLKHGDRAQVVGLLVGRGQMEDALDECLMAGEWTRAAELAESRLPDQAVSDKGVMELSDGAAPSSDETHEAVRDLIFVLRARQAAL